MSRFRKLQLFFGSTPKSGEGSSSSGLHLQAWLRGLLRRKRKIADNMMRLLAKLNPQLLALLVEVQEDFPPARRQNRSEWQRWDLHQIWYREKRFAQT